MGSDDQQLMIYKPSKLGRT